MPDETPKMTLKNTNPVFAQLEANVSSLVRSATSFEGQVHVQVDETIISDFDVRVERRGDDFLLFVSNMAPVPIVTKRVPAVISYMYYAGPEVKELMFHLSDGQLPSSAQCSFSSYDAAMHLIPDFYFFRDRGYRDLRNWLQLNEIPWEDRNREFIWRGRVNGGGFFSVDPAQSANPLVRQRLRLAMLAKKTRLDFRFTVAGSKIEEHLARAAGLMSERVEPRTWLNRKFAIDIDGVSNAWDNLFHRMLLGNCVLKVESQMGFRQWYYDRLIPFEHFVPIRKDLSDLEEKIDWVLTHDAETREIAGAGRRLAQSLTWEATMDEMAAGLQQLYRASM